MHADTAHHVGQEMGRLFVVRQISGGVAQLVDDQQKEYTFSQDLLPAGVEVGERLIMIVETEKEAQLHRTQLAKELLQELLQDQDKDYHWHGKNKNNP